MADNLESPSTQERTRKEPISVQDIGNLLRERISQTKIAHETENNHQTEKKLRDAEAEYSNFKMLLHRMRYSFIPTSHEARGLVLKLYLPEVREIEETRARDIMAKKNPVDSANLAS